MTDWDPSAVAAALRTENRFSGGSVVGVLAVGHSQTRMWVLESQTLSEPGSGQAPVAGTPVILAEHRLDGIGSEMFDRLLLDRALQRIGDIPGADEALAEHLRRPRGEPWSSLRGGLIAQVRRAREELTAWHSATVEVDAIPGISPDGPLRLDRIELDNALRPHVLRMARDFGATIEASGHRPAQLDGIYLLGDGRMPLIVRSVYDVLGVSPTVGQDLVSARLRGGSEVPEPVTRRGPVPGQAQPVSPAQGLTLRPSAPKGGRVVVPGTTAARPEPTPVAPSVDPDDADVYRPGSQDVVGADASELPDGEVATHGAQVNGTPQANGTAANGTAANGTAQANGRSVNGTAQVSGTAQVNGATRVNGTAQGDGASEVNGTARVNGSPRVHGTDSATPKVNGSPKAGAVAGGLAVGGADKGRQPELTDTGSLRLLRDEDDGFDEDRLNGSGTSSAKKRRRLLVPVLGGVVVMVAASAIVVGLVRNDSSTPAAGSSKTVDTSLSTSTTAPPSPTVSPTPEVAVLSAVAQVRARPVGIAVALTWAEVEGAERYAVYRDPGTAAEKRRTTITTKLTDRPGDGKTHTYAVVALDAEENEGENGNLVRAKAAAPYGKLQNIASNWTGIVPQKPGRKGSSDQICEPKANKLAGSDGRIVCRYPDGLVVTVFHYGSQTATDHRYNDLSATKGVKSGTWRAKLHDDVQATGRLLTGSRGKAPWRWWAYESAPSYAIQAQWPGHSAAELADWVKQRMPFHS